MVYHTIPSYHDDTVLMVTKCERTSVCFANKNPVFKQLVSSINKQHINRYSTTNFNKSWKIFNGNWLFFNVGSIVTAFLFYCLTNSAADEKQQAKPFTVITPMLDHIMRSPDAIYLSWKFIFYELGIHGNTCNVLMGYFNVL